MNKEKIPLEHAKRVRRWRQEHPERAKEISKLSYRRNAERRKLVGITTHCRRKIRVLTYYGNGKLACVKCGFDNIKALSIDHINGGGLKHRRELGINSGSNFYRWLEVNGYPEGFQTLCMNCQYIKKIEKKEI